MKATNRGLLRLFVVLAALTLAAAAWGAAGSPSRSSGPAGGSGPLAGATFTVGSKEFTEQLILGHITKQALEAAGATVKDEIGLSGTVVARKALTSGKIDMYWEYTGTGWITHLKKTKPIPDSRRQYAAVAKADLKNGITWLATAPFDNTYAFTVRTEAAKQLGVTKISDFRRLIQRDPDKATFCAASEFLTRDDGLPGIEKRYGFEFPEDNVTELDLGVVYTEVDKGRTCNFGEAFATDGRIAALGLTVIRDDRKFFPVYNPALNVRTSVLKKYPALRGLFARIATKLDTKTMQALNASVDVKGKFPEQVAKDWLKKNRFAK